MLFFFFLQLRETHGRSIWCFPKVPSTSALRAVYYVCIYERMYFFYDAVSAVWWEETADGGGSFMQRHHHHHHHYQSTTDTVFTSFISFCFPLLLLLLLFSSLLPRLLLASLSGPASVMRVAKSWRSLSSTPFLSLFVASFIDFVFGFSLFFFLFLPMRTTASGC